MVKMVNLMLNAFYHSIKKCHLKRKRKASVYVPLLALLDEY